MSQLTGHKCFYCNIPLIELNKHELFDLQMKVRKWPHNQQTDDHAIPKSRGGGSGKNLVLCCRKCNNAKGNLTLDEYRVVLMKRAGFCPCKAKFLFPGEVKQRQLNRMKNHPITNFLNTST